MTDAELASLRESVNRMEAWEEERLAENASTIFEELLYSCQQLVDDFDVYVSRGRDSQTVENARRVIQTAEELEPRVIVTLKPRED